MFYHTPKHNITGHRSTDSCIPIWGYLKLCSALIHSEAAHHVMFLLFLINLFLIIRLQTNVQIIAIQTNETENNVHTYIVHPHKGNDMTLVNSWLMDS